MDGTTQLSATAYCLSNSAVYANCFFNFWQLSQSIDNNYTTIRFEAWIDQRGIQWTGTTRKKGGIVSAWINESCVFSEYYPLNNGGANTRVWYSGVRDINVYHNSDGSKSCTFELKLDTGVDEEGNTQIYKWGGSDKVSTTQTLTSIPRASKPSLSASEKTTGDTIGITTNRKSGNFTHSLWWDCGNSTWNGIASGVGDSYSWTIPHSLANAIASATSATVVIRCRTYSGNTQIGSDQTTSFKVNVYSGIVPSISAFSVWDTVSNVSNKFGLYLKGASKLGISFDDSGSYGSWITYRRITVNGQTFENSKSAATNVLSWSGSMEVKVTVSDSRGRSASTSTTITVQNYGMPWIESFKGIRCNSDGSTNDGGSYIKLQFKAGVYSVGSKNTAQYQLGYCVSGSNNYAWKVLDISSLSYDSTTGVISGLTFSPDKSYDLILWVGDKLNNEARRPDTLATEFVLTDYYAEGTGMAIGKVAESSNLFDVGIDAKFRKNIYADNGICAGDSTYFGAPIYGAGGTTAWVHLGTWTSGGDAHNCMITVFTGAGYNGGSDQNTTIKINIKDGWQSSYSASGSFGITYTVEGNYYSNIKVKGIASAHNVIDVWIYMPWTYWNGDYIFQGFGSWKHIATNQSAEPTGNEQSCMEMSTTLVRDFYNGSMTKLAYSQPSMGYYDTEWIACWNGYELRGISRNELEQAYYDSSSEWTVFRFGNGLMVMKRFTKYTISFSGHAWGNIYGFDCNKNMDEIPDYPVAFTSTPSRFISLCDGGDGNAICAFPDVDGMKRPLNNFGGWIVTRPTAVGITYMFSLTAVGWWK